MNFNFLFKDGFIVDGTGGTWYRADVGIKDGKISEVCKNIPVSGADRIIDAKGLVVCPGFYDMHCHSELHYVNTISDLGSKCAGKIRMGVTLEFNGQCGGSSTGPLIEASLDNVKKSVLERDLPVEINWTNLAEYMDRLEKFGGVSVNSAYMVGFGTVRMAVLGWENRSPTRDEMDEMKAYVAEAMEAGAFGLSTGLQYPPQNFAETDEVVELAKVVAKYGGIHQAHVRRQGHIADPRGGRSFITRTRDSMREAVRECIEIGERAGIPTVWSHAKAIPGWKLDGRAEELLREVDNARTRGVDVTVDHWANPYTGVVATQVFPLWAFEGGVNQMLNKLRDAEMRSKIRPIVKETIEGGSPQLDFNNSIITRAKLEKNKQYVGRSFIETSKLKGKELVDFYLDWVMDGETDVNGFGRFCTDEDMSIMMKHPAVIFGTDWSSIGVLPKQGKDFETRGGYKTYPMILRKYVREERVIPLEEAVRKMTSAGANKLGLTDRGLIRPGMWADITVFDPLNVRERDGDYPEGIPYVLVNGVLTVDEGKHTGARAGKILKHKYYVK